MKTTEDPEVLENLNTLNLKSLSTIALANEYMILSSTLTSENIADAIRCELNKRLEMM